jgi:hypothetical protein
VQPEEPHDTDYKKAQLNGLNRDIQCYNMISVAFLLKC